LQSLEDRPLVGVLVDTTYKFGASIVRGVLRYANLKRRWLLYKDLIVTVETHDHWPAFDAAICAAMPSDAVVRQLNERCKHVVLCSAAGDPDVCPVVCLDGAAAGAQAAAHLIERRLEHFAFYSKLGRVGVQRGAGFREALAARGFTPCDELTVHRSSLDRSHQRDLIRWLERLPKPVGILAADDMDAHHLADACLEANLAVPEQVAIIGINNDDLLCEGAWPPLSSVEGDFTRIGYIAAQLVERLLGGEQLDAADRLHRLPPLGVVQRQSTNVLAVKDENLARAIQYIREHACDPCNVNDVLRAVPVGRRWLEKLFLSQLGRTPHDEIARVRVETAKRFLRETGLKLPDISYRCGFSELKRFYITFRNVAGTTPGAYRRSHHGAG
jgi:LacI family transcriptional regulator